MVETTSKPTTVSDKRDVKRSPAKRPTPSPARAVMPPAKIHEPQPLAIRPSSPRAGPRQAASRIRWEGVHHTPEPETALDMATVRHGIDEVDAALVALLARRMRFIERAGVIKRDRSAVRDEWRKADVLAKVEASALRHGFPPDLARELWERLVEASIAHEFEVFDAGDAAGELL